ncbi:ribosome-binding factor A [Alphaproteobacteria bacterium]|nr:ribosome-binding factor A [Alphaproteobacteria bacterium]
MSKHSAKIISNRQLKVGELIRHKISEELLRGSFFEDLESNLSVTVTEVKMSSNLKTAIVYVLPLTGQNSHIMMDILKDLAPRLQGKISRSLGLRFTPKMDFKLDVTFDYVDKIDALISLNKRDNGK